MAVKLKITRKDKWLGQKDFLGLIDDFINDSYAGRRTKKNGSRIGDDTIGSYMHLRKHMIGFSKVSTFELKLYVVNNLSQNEKQGAKRYYKKFYVSFTDYLYDKKGLFDNYIGHLMKLLRCIFNYFEEERNISIGTFHRSFFVPKEEIPIIALDHEQLNYIIYNKEFDKVVKEHRLEKVKDIFIFGCTVALRISDLAKLSPKNLLIQKDKYYIQVKSQKTHTHTSIKLPDYAIAIIEKYRDKQKTLLPTTSKVWTNQKFKEMGRLIPDDYEMIKTRERRGKQIVIYKDPVKKIHYMFSDHITSHTMRKTGITTMLSLGMPEHVVRKISGHAANSKEFYRYVRLTQSFIDNHTDQVFDRIKAVSNED